MSEQLKRTPLGEGITYNVVLDPKFKHNRMTVNFILPLSRETATQYALLPLLLRKGYRGCPDFTRFNARLNELYGAVLGGDIAKYGQYQVIQLSILGLDDRFCLDNEKLTEECARMLCGVVCEPKIENGRFDAKDVELEKQFLRDTIEAEINDKRGYAMTRCRGIMCEGEATAVRKYGYAEDLDAITPETCAAAYEKMLETAAIEIMFVGSGDPEPAGRIFRETLASRRRSPITHGLTPGVLSAASVRTEEEAMDLVQAKLVLGFRTGKISTPGELMAMRMMTAVYGGTSFAKLFLNVREKMSLCYYCAARLDRHAGLMMVDCGIELGNREKAQAEILHQLDLIRQGNVTEEELANTKLSMKNGLRSITDMLSTTEDWYLGQIMALSESSPMDEMELLDRVTIEDVVEAAKKVTLDTVYLLGSRKE